MRFVSAPTTAFTISTGGNNGSAANLTLRLNTDGTLSLLSGTTVRATSTSAFTNDGLWHRVDFDCGWSSGSGMRVFVDGVQWASNSTDTGVVPRNRWQIGDSASNTYDVYIDDVVCYDSALPATLDDYNVDLLLPTSDSAAGGWVAQDDGGTNVNRFFRGTDNVPPVGSTATAASPIIRIENTVSSATDNFDAMCEAYYALQGGYYTTAPATANGFGTTTKPKLAQAFIWKAGGDLAQVMVSLRKQGSPTDDLTVSIQADSSGDPSGTPLVSTTLAGTSLTTSFAERLFTLSTSLTVGVTYWVVLERSGASNDTNFYQAQTGVFSLATSTVPENTPSGKSYNGSVWSAGTNYMYMGVRNSTTDPTIHAVQAICNDAQAVTTGSPKAGAVVITANPSGQTEQSFDYGLPNGTAGSTSAAAMGTFPAGWGTHVGPVTESPSVTLTSGPTVRVGKRTATTREVDVDFLGCYVVWEPPAAAPSGTWWQTAIINA